MSGKHSENKKNEVGCLFPKKDIKMEMCFSNSDIANLAEFLKKFSLIYKILKNIIIFFIITFKSCCPNFADERRILSKKHYLAEFSFWEGLLKVNVLGQYVFIDSYVVVLQKRRQILVSYRSNTGRFEKDMPDMCPA